MLMSERDVVATADAVMDVSVLQEFLAMVGPAGPELLRGIVEIYAVETPPVLSALGVALDADDHEAAMRLAHRLKGSCLSIGASRLAATCVAIEQLCSMGEAPSSEAYASLRHTFDATTVALRQFVGALPR